jgi:hypothetical protein
MGEHEQLEHRELSAEELEAVGKRAHEIDLKVKTAVRGSRATAWDLCEALYEVRDNSIWKDLGIETLEEYLGDPERGLKRTTFFRYSALWEQLVIIHGVDPDRLRGLDPTKVDVVLPSITSGKVTIDKGLADAESLSASDLREVYSDREIEPGDDDPPPDTLPGSRWTLEYVHRERGGRWIVYEGEQRLSPKESLKLSFEGEVVVESRGS